MMHLTKLENDGKEYTSKKEHQRVGIRGCRSKFKHGNNSNSAVATTENP
jgi:hypothetical protein